jgi:hypothetical protein
VLRYSQREFAALHGRVAAGGGRSATFCSGAYLFVKATTMVEELRCVPMSKGEREAIECGNALLLALLRRLSAAETLVRYS